MSTNVDIQNQNTELQLENNISESVGSKDPVVTASSESETQENSNTQTQSESSTSTPPGECEVNGDSQSSVDNDIQSDTNRARRIEASSVINEHNQEQTSMEVDTSCLNDTVSIGKTNTATETESETGSVNVINKVYGDKPNQECNDDSTTSSPQNNCDVTQPSTDVSMQEESCQKTPDSIPESISTNTSVTPTSPSDISCSSQTSNNVPSISDQNSTNNECLDQSEVSTALASGLVEDDEKPSCSKSKDSGPLQSTYHIKWIKFRDESCPIITQNENGPCPLIAIMNVLLMQRKVKFPPMMEMVTSSQLMDYLGDCILEYAPKNMTEDALLNYEQNMHDAMAVFHKLQTGLDVNVRFTGVGTFEYTSECIVFDLLEIHLYHGWLVDPGNIPEVSIVGNNSYNQLVEMIIRQKQSTSDDQVREALVAEEFLNRSSHQLTYHGLCELASTVKENELCVFFRNNHFSTLFKHKNELFLLVTDQGFLTESNVVWETLSNVEGDGHFVDAHFHTYRKPEPSTHPIPASNVADGDMQIDQDYLVALSLQQEQQTCETQTVAPDWNPQNTVQDWNPQLSDHEIAMKLQEEENRRVAMALQRQEQQAAEGQGTQQQQQSPRQPQARPGRDPRESSSSSSSKKSDCNIL